MLYFDDIMYILFQGVFSLAIRISSPCLSGRGDNIDCQDAALSGDSSCRVFSTFTSLIRRQAILHLILEAAQGSTGAPLGNSSYLNRERDLVTVYFCIPSRG